MAKWVEVQDRKGKYWIKKKSDKKIIVIYMLVMLLAILGAMFVREKRDNIYLMQELEVYQSQPDYFLPQD